MKRIIAVFMALVLVLSLAACGGSSSSNDNQNSKNCEVAMITDSGTINDGSFNQATWESIEEFSSENNLACKHYKPKEATKEAYLTSIQKAVDDKAKIIIMAGSNFETTVYTAQTTYPEVYFLLIDGVPHDESNNYATAANTIGIIFAEEDAGYLAGYAAVKEGYTKLGFMGGIERPPVKRYGYGYVQGASAAAAETKTKIEIRYAYTGTFDESDAVQDAAKTWYKEGTEVIFACGGAMGKSVIKAAEKNSGKVIGTDIDQSGISATVITSAEKGIDTAVKSSLKQYVNEKFVGGLAFNYTAKNDGVMLEMENAKLTKFTEDDYKKVFRELKNGKIELKKDTDVAAVTEFASEWVTLKQ